MSKSIKAYSPMRSCSNYTLKLINNHFDVDVVESPWKHGSPTTDPSDYPQDTMPDGILFCLKNPYALWESFKRGFTKGHVRVDHFQNHNDPYFTDVMDLLDQATQRNDGSILSDEEVLGCWIQKQTDLLQSYLSFYTNHKDSTAIICHEELLDHAPNIVKQIGKKFDCTPIADEFEDIGNQVATNFQLEPERFPHDYYTQQEYLDDLTLWEYETITDEMDWDLLYQFGYEPMEKDTSIDVTETINLVYYGDFGCHTGFGRVSDGILPNLPDSWNIRALAINFTPGLKDEQYPDNITPYSIRFAGQNPYGPRETISYLNQTEFDYDLVFGLQDPFLFANDLTQNEEGPNAFIEHIGEAVHKRKAKLVTYFPVDTHIPNPSWFKPILNTSDRSVAYLDWARDKIIDLVSDSVDTSSLDVINHGCNNDMFYPLSDEVIESGANQLGIDPDQFTFLWFSANQRRKNIPRDVMGAFAKLVQQRPEAKLLMKTTMDTSDQEGWNLQHIQRQLHHMMDIPPNSIEFLTQHYSDRELNLIYNIADCVYLPSMEGHGLTVTEAYSARRPTITADHGALSELGDEGRSLQVECPQDLNHTVWFTRDNNVPRSMIDIDDFVEKAKNMMDMTQQKQVIAQNGYEWAQNHSWETQAEKWQQLFQEVLVE